MRMDVENDFVTAAIAPTPLCVKMVGIFALGICGIRISQSEMFAVPFKIISHWLAGEIVRDYRVTGQNARPAVLNESAIDLC